MMQCASWLHVCVYISSFGIFPACIHVLVGIHMYMYVCIYAYVHVHVHVGSSRAKFVFTLALCCLNCPEMLNKGLQCVRRGWLTCTIYMYMHGGRHS